MIFYILGQVIRLEGLLLTLPCITSVIYREHEALYFLVVIVICLVLGTLMTLKKPENQTIYLKEGCIATAFSWLVLGILGCLPFYLSGEIPSFTDALFETISGLTTTGASILSEVESMSRGMMFWRCFTHWIGGMGVLVFLLAIMPMNGGSHMNLMKAESPGPSVGKLVPKVKHTARLLYVIYLVMTMVEVVFLLFGHMSLYDSLCTAFGTAGTGGFGIKNDSFASFSPYIQWVVTVFMLLFGVNFNFYYYVILKNIRKALSMEEVRTYFGIILVSILIIFTNIVKSVGSVAEAVRQAAFQVASIITTTGYSTVDFDLWPNTSKTILVMLMFIGACAGSTGGGMKVSRIVIMIKTVVKELSTYFHPKNVKKINLDGKPIDHVVLRAVNVYFITFIAVFVGSVFLLSFDDYDLVTNFTAVAATMNNIGPGLSMVGPACNFGFFSTFSKYVLMFDMLAGRLELFPLLLIFTPSIYKDMALSLTKRIKLKKNRAASL
jgi:trk system potassium uptake protein TrkH